MTALDAAWFGARWAYLNDVIGDAWPRRFWISTRLNPACTTRLAKVCRNECSVIPSIPHRLQARTNAPGAYLRAVPLCDSKTNIWVSLQFSKPRLKPLWTRAVTCNRDSLLTFDLYNAMVLFFK